ncbi:MAG TPA: YtxH domain-containing protein [Flavobacterium sp.]|jgi:gas vesicle protein|nr:YtxH domain-containing protein [Flavobacterium sp.]HPJ09839.1 YtxH domain-containing protein [Flavobacterium sp.]
MSTGNTVLGFVAGAAIGAIAGILYAPAKGSETREKLRDGLDDIKNNLQDKFENATDDLKGQISNAKFDLEETYENLVSTMSHKAEDVIAFLETKLADLKAQNAKYQKENKTQYSE